MPNSRTSPSSGIYSLRHWALTFKLTQQQIKTTRFAHHWDTTIRCRYFCRHRLYSRLTTPHRRTPVSSRVSRPDLVPVSFSSFTFLREGITLQQSCQDGVVGTVTVEERRASSTQSVPRSPLIRSPAPYATPEPYPYPPPLVTKEQTSILTQCEYSYGASTFLFFSRFTISASFTVSRLAYSIGKNSSPALYSKLVSVLLTSYRVTTPPFFWKGTIAAGRLWRVKPL